MEKGLAGRLFWINMTSQIVAEIKATQSFSMDDNVLQYYFFLKCGRRT